jgi:DNA-binding response OmpR family regulator
MKSIILLVEGKRSDGPSFMAGLVKKGHQVESASSGNVALAYLDGERPNLVIINAASMRTSGKRICQSIRQKMPDLPIVLILDSKAETVEKGMADVVLTLPFTLQKLLNRIRPFLPVEKKDMLKAGPLELDVEQRWLIHRGKQTRMTPRLMALLKILMEHPGEVVERKDLFKQAWETEYTEDMRTLDVHISWLREIVEDDPRHPRYLKTVRGVGYRLDTGVDSATRPGKRGLRVAKPADSNSPEH